MSETRIEMPSHCPDCGAPIDPADFHFDGTTWSYECAHCGTEKPCSEWLAQARGLN